MASFHDRNKKNGKTKLKCQIHSYEEVFLGKIICLAVGSRYNQLHHFVEDITYGFTPALFLNLTQGTVIVY
jgi:hypothetical protein